MCKEKTPMTLRGGIEAMVIANADVPMPGFARTAVTVFDSSPPLSSASKPGQPVGMKIDFSKFNFNMSTPSTS